MTVFHDKARGRWRYDFRLDGTRHSGYCVDPETGAHAATKTQAKRCENLARAAALKAVPKPTAPVAFTVAQMLAAYATRKQQKGRDWDNKRVYIAELLRWFGAETPVTDLTEQRIWDYVAWARQQPVMIYAGGSRVRPPEERTALYRPSGRTRSDSTINRYLVCLGESLRIAHGRRDGMGRPLLPDLPKVPKLSEAQHLSRPVSDDDIRAIVANPRPIWPTACCWPG